MGAKIETFRGYFATLSLRPFWDAQGSQKTAERDPKGSQNGAQREPKGTQTGDKMFIKSDFPRDPVQERSGHQNGAKMERKYNQN